MYKRVWNKRVLAKVFLLSIPHSATFIGFGNLFSGKGEESMCSTGTALLLFVGGLVVFILAYLWFFTHDEEMANFLSGDDWFLKSKTRSIMAWFLIFIFIDCGVMFSVSILFLVLTILFAVLTLIGHGIYWLFS